MLHSKLSSTIDIGLSVSLFMLNPEVIALFIVYSAFIVKCFILNPVLGCGILQVICNVRWDSFFSSVLAIGGSSAIGLHDALFEGVCYLGMGMSLPNFQMWGIWFWRNSCHICVRGVPLLLPNHSIFLAKLSHCRIRGIANHWFKSYLSNSQLCARVGDVE